MFVTRIFYIDAYIEIEGNSVESLIRIMYLRNMYF